MWMIPVAIVSFLVGRKSKTLSWQDKVQVYNDVAEKLRMSAPAFNDSPSTVRPPTPPPYVEK